MALRAPVETSEPREEVAESRVMTVAYEPPANDIQRRLVQIWEGYLGVQGIGIRDNFFELGGDSLLASSVFAGIREEFDVDVPLRAMLQFATIRHVYLFIATTRNANAVEEFSEEELNDFFSMANTLSAADLTIRESSAVAEINN
jgi:acyl carrier protein